MHAQVVVLGGGPGGYAAAFSAADRGLDVAIVDEQGQLGGECLLRGCIPSKALLHVAKVIAESRHVSEWGVAMTPAEIDIDMMRARKEKLIATLTGGLAQLAKRRKTRVIVARGQLQDSKTLRLSGGDPATYDDETLTFDHLILATGSQPVVPAALACDSPRVMTSAGALDLPDVPASLLVIGGGYIGLEMATVYAQLGSAVSIVEMTDELLPGVDRDLIKPLAKNLESLCDGRIFLETEVTGLADRGDHIEVSFAGAKSGSESYARVLVAVGRRPNSAQLGLENTGVVVNERGFVEVDAQRRTAEPNIFAIGDLAGEPMLAHKAAHEGKVAAAVIAGETDEFDKLAIPAVVFTDPEVATAGYSEVQAKAQGIPYEVALFPWAASGRAQAVGATAGLTKLLVDPESGQILGAGLVGSGAGELIAEVVLAIETGSTAYDLSETIHPHPTLSETVAFAGEVQLGTATEIYKPKRQRTRS
ncbi:MAG: dihydrolipoyl dehydrogenase [Planctomycetota bacterium]|nr:MAG: dihydrolipoyl dehydrogenase [Planctomycetota bacterium]REJ97615.1 MAG: dihydrolipoyl dehydrogenase [Planctomycetota bacterium]REK23037.1 MAG: dihydrolipoyl dehydrogenase [Planctomycetota bacterium]REK43401.1 MAG: dihydrolipoyl dehydrogenase [Planctomycetota bacterium]